MPVARNWRDQAACRDHPIPDLWFPLTDTPRSKLEQEDIAAAKKICRGCPVRLDCLRFALEHGSKGIWGGMLDRERRYSRLCRALRAQLADEQAAS